MFESSRLGAGIEVSDVSWQGHQGAICDVSLMVLHRVDLSGVKFDRFIAHGTVFSECNFDGAVLNGAEIIRWRGPWAVEQSPLEHFPSLSPDSTWDPSDFELEDDWYGDEDDSDRGFSIQRWNRPCFVTNCSMRGVEMAVADLSDLFVVDSELLDANLTNANLSDATFGGVSLAGANLTGATLVDCAFLNVDLSGANFTGANLKGVYMEEDVVLNRVIGYER
jgi:uncharacterized protein YjbI with pentapeptide repeats